MNKQLRIKLTLLSPVNIGCDDAYDPLSFVVDEKRKKLIVFDPVDFFNSLDEEQQKQFSKLCMGDSILPIYKFVRLNYKQGIEVKEVDLADGVIVHYNEVMALPITGNGSKKDESKFTIEKTVYSPYTGEPYIPGSSLKGSIRTAYLNSIARERGIKGRKDSKVLEKELLGGQFNADPFRLVKVSDLFPANEPQTAVLYALNKKKKAGDKGINETGPPQLFEAVGKGVSFTGTISLLSPEGGAVKTPVTEDTLIKSINDFYKKIWEEESGLLRKAGSSFSSKYPANSIRIGRHSGAEAMTIEGNRKIKISPPKKPEKVGTAATTFWFASAKKKVSDWSHILPFGWAVLSFLDEGEYQGEVQKKDERIVLKQRCIEDIRKKRVEAVQKQIEEKKAREEALKKEEEEMQRKKREWEEMSEEDRMIAIVKDDHVSGNSVMETYSKLDAIADADKKRELAHALKDYFIRNNKWKKKEISKKQREKVLKIKRVLGEE